MKFTKKFAAMFLAAALLSALCCVSISAEENSALFTADTATKGEWVGKYGKDGYFIFANSLETCTDNLPEYVNEFTYTTLFGEPVSYHQWWRGVDDSAPLPEPHGIEDAIWTDEAKTDRILPAIYNGLGVSLTIDVGDKESDVTIYSIDGGDDGRCVEVTMLDADGNTIGTYDLTNFVHGTYVTATITGKVTFDYTYYDGLNRASNAVIGAVFFDGVNADEAPEAAPAETEAEPEAAPEEAAPAETEAVPEEPAEEAAESETVPENTETEIPAETAPQTFDIGIISAVAAVISLAGFSLSKKK